MVVLEDGVGVGVGDLEDEVVFVKIISDGVVWKVGVGEVVKVVVLVEGGVLVWVFVVFVFGFGEVDDVVGGGGEFGSYFCDVGFGGKFDFFVKLGCVGRGVVVGLGGGLFVVFVGCWWGWGWRIWWWVFFVCFWEFDFDGVVFCNIS